MDICSIKILLFRSHHHENRGRVAIRFGTICLFLSVAWAKKMETVDRRIRRTQKSLHQVLISLVLEKDYDLITVQEILDRADVGRPTFYAHFDGKDQLLISGTHELRNTLNAAL